MARKYVFHSNYAVIYFDTVEQRAYVHAGMTAKESRILYDKIVSNHKMINAMRVKTMGDNRYYTIYYPGRKYEKET